MLLYIYLGSTLLVWIDTIGHQIYLDRRLKKEGYKFNNNKYFGFGDIVIGAFYLMALSVPVVNLFFPLSHLNKDRSYDEYKNYLLEAGAIDEPDLDIHVKVVKNNESNVITNINQNKKDYYQPLYRDENNLLDLDDDKGYSYRKIKK